MPPINRVVFLIDGFNVYHSVKSASHDLGLGGSGTRWLNIHSWCRSYFSAMGALTGNAQIQIEGIYYFSALATHLLAIDADVIKRHETYIECLEASGVTVELSRFKKKKIQCPHCSQNVVRREEKETDVAIASKLLEVFHLNQCDTAMIVTGDTDIVPAFRTAQRLFPHKHIGFLLPYKRHNKEITLLNPLHFLVPKEAYARHQFSDPFVTSAGKPIAKPPSW